MTIYTANHLLLPTLWWLYPTPSTPPPIGTFHTPSYTLPSYSLPSMFLPTTSTTTTTSTRNQGYKTTKITLLLQKAYFYSYLYHNVYYKSRLFHYHNKWYPPQLLHYNHFTPTTPPHSNHSPTNGISWRSLTITFPPPLDKSSIFLLLPDPLGELRTELQTMYWDRHLQLGIQ